jgi:hypothetical protein
VWLYFYLSTVCWLLRRSMYCFLINLCQLQSLLFYLWRKYGKVLLDILLVVQPVKNFPVSYNTNVHYCVHKIQSLKSTQHAHTLFPWRPILILSSHSRLSHVNTIFSSRFLTKICYAFLIFPIRAKIPCNTSEIKLQKLCLKQFCNETLEFYLFYFSSWCIK